MTDNIAQYFQISSLNMLSRAALISDSAKLYMGEEEPLLVEYSMKFLGRLRFHLAQQLIAVE